VEIVRSFQADAAQGFFFARPMSSENAAELARCDEVPHFSRTSEQTLLRRVGGTTVEEAIGRGPGVEQVVGDPGGDVASDGGGDGPEAGGAGPAADGPAADGPEDVLLVTDEFAPATEDTTHEEATDERDEDDPAPDPALDGDADLLADGPEDEVSDAGSDEDRPVVRAAGVRVGRKRLKNRSSRSA
jgi:hypothetical protein